MKVYSFHWVYFMEEYRMRILITLHNNRFISVQCFKVIIQVAREMYHMSCVWVNFRMNYCVNINFFLHSPLESRCLQHSLQGSSYIISLFFYQIHFIIPRSSFFSYIYLFHELQLYFTHLALSLPEITLFCSYNFSLNIIKRMRIETKRIANE